MIEIFEKKSKRFQKSGIVVGCHPEVRGVYLGCGLGGLGASALNAGAIRGLRSDFVRPSRDLYGIPVTAAGVGGPVANRKK